MKVGDCATVLINKYGYQWTERGILGPKRRHFIEQLGIRRIALIRIKEINHDQA